MNNKDDMLEQAKRDPRTAQLISKLSPDDVERLRGVLSSPESIKRILSTDKARELMRSLGVKNDQ